MKKSLSKKNFKLLTQNFAMLITASALITTFVYDAPDTLAEQEIESYALASPSPSPWVKDIDGGRYPELAGCVAHYPTLTDCEAGTNATLVSKDTATAADNSIEEVHLRERSSNEPTADCLRVNEAVLVRTQFNCSVYCTPLEGTRQEGFAGDECDQNGNTDAAYCLCGD